jgi:hypothetical protein
MGTTPELAPLFGMALITIVLGTFAVRLFRWE